MKKLEDLFQERLERLQRGEPLEACVAGLPKAEAELLALVAGLGELGYPEPDRDAVAAQRANLLRLAEKETKMATQSPKRAKKGFALPRWFIPVTALSGVVATFFLCALIVVAGAGFFWWRSRDAAEPPRLAAHPTAEVQVTQTRTPRPTPTPTLKARATAEPTSTPALKPTSTPTSMSEPTVPEVAPAVSPLQVPDAQSGVLREVQGVVEVQGADDTWAPAPVAGRVVGAGDRVRTGALSTASLAFYDGSVAHLGPNTELSVDELDARASDGPRVVALTQWSGDTEHDVVPSADDGSRYEVNTPSGSGVARGTIFRVQVTQLLAAYFIVDEGLVAVTHLDVTVLVVAGQLTIVPIDGAPSEPFFRVTGEGEVERTGPTWTIAGQDFETHETTVIVGNPQAGDWVYVDGHLLPGGTRVADRIVLLHRAPQDEFTIQGEVNAIADGEWTVAGQAILVNDETQVLGEIEEGDLVKVVGVIQEGGVLLAKRIVLIEEQQRGLPFRFVGVVQEIVDDTWTISAIEIAVNADTQIDSDLRVGDVVEVRGWILRDDTWLASSIARMEQAEREFEFTGYVERIRSDSWRVSGIVVETDEWTEIEEDIGIGDAVVVEGHILDDGTWIADEIKLLDDEGLYLEFVGTVTSTNPWIVSGIVLTVDSESEIVGDIDVGTLVKVKARILPEGLVIRKMAPLDVGWPGGCMWFTSEVVLVDGGRIVLRNGATLSLREGVHVVGEVDVHSVVLIRVCVAADGSLTVVAIIVIYQIDPSIVPLPLPVPPPGPRPPSPPGDGEITICHKPGTSAEQTKRIPRSAWPGHKAHGDHRGPCGARRR